MRYSDSPLRCTRRTTSTSGASSGSHLALLSSTMRASARPAGARLSEPAKITSSMRRARIRPLAVPPRTQRSASMMFDLPEPLGPTTAVMPGPIWNWVRVAKDL